MEVFCNREWEIRVRKWGAGEEERTAGKRRLNPGISESAKINSDLNLEKPYGESGEGNILGLSSTGEVDWP